MRLIYIFSEKFFISIKFVKNLQNMWLLALALLYLVPTGVGYSYVDQPDDFHSLSLDLGKSLGVDKHALNDIPSDTLQRIVDGADAGNKENTYFLGILRLYGISFVQNATMAAYYFDKAAELGNVDALTAYGVLSLSGYGIPKDYNKAIHYFRRAVMLNDFNAYWLLGKMLLEGKGVNEPDYEEAIILFKNACEEGIPQANFYVALMYEYGLGVDFNIQLAISHYEAAIGNNHLDSMYNLGLIYGYGRSGIDQNYAKALYYFDKAAMENHAPSTYYMGVFKLYGYGCMPNYDHAINWFERAASMDNYQVSTKAAAAAKELRQLVDRATEENERIQSKYQAMADNY